MCETTHKHHAWISMVWFSNRNATLWRTSKKTSWKDRSINSCQGQTNKSKMLGWLTFNLQNQTPVSILNIQAVNFEHTSVTQSILCMIFLMYVSIIQHENKIWQTKKIHIFHFSTNVGPWNKVKVIKSGMTKQGYKPAKFERCHLKHEKWQSLCFLSNQGTL